MHKKGYNKGTVSLGYNNYTTDFIKAFLQPNGLNFSS